MTGTSVAFEDKVKAGGAALRNHWGWALIHLRTGPDMPTSEDLARTVLLAARDLEAK